MKKLFYILVLFAGVAKAQIVNIPDANFKAKLIALGVDNNADGQIQQSEALVPTTLNLNQSNIANVTGIEAFTNLLSLDCSYNQLTSLNVTAITNLAILNCFNNQLTNLNVSGMTNLGVLNCYNNQLSSLNLSGLINLAALNCYTNQLTSLNLNGLTNLAAINCSFNLIPSLDVTGLTLLQGLNCYNNKITSLTVTGLPNLVNLICNDNLLTSLNVSNLNALQTLYCYNNQLTTANFTGLPLMQNLDCHANQIASLDASTFSNLRQLKCQNNSITNLNVAGLTQLQSLNCSNNLLGILDISGVNVAGTLDCSYNQLTSLICNAANADTLDCSHNQLITLDLSSMTNLQQLGFNNNPLTSLNVYGLHNLQSVGCANTLLNTLDLGTTAVMYVAGNNNPNLSYVNLKNGAISTCMLLIGMPDNCVSFNNCPALNAMCLDEDEIQYFGVFSFSVDITSYCNFTPGGNYNTITGTVTFDSNNDGCDASDDIQSNIRVNISDGTNAGASYTNDSGSYTFYTQAGTFNLTPAIENPTWFTFSPTTATIPFVDNNNNTVSQNFCITANGVHPDVEVIVAPITRARPGFDAVYKVVYKNKGNQTLNGVVSFAYDEAKMDYVSATQNPDLTNPGVLFWDFGVLQPFENRSINITLHVNSPTDTPAVNIGDQLNLSATVDPVVTDEFPSDNTFQYNEKVIGSFDPNDITCIEGNVVAPSEIGNYLHYIINFENTGTADAENIVVRDVIDTTQFDVNSLQVLNSSNPVTAKLTGNMAEFIFQNISLHSGGHGNILIKIKSKNTLVEGNTVSKKANIYFDYNAPVDTNIENTTFQQLSNPDFETDASISIYPNPTKGDININCDNVIKSVQLYDIQGRLLQTNLVNENHTSLDISNKSNGVYFIKVLSDKGILVQKMVRD